MQLFGYHISLPNDAKLETEHTIGVLLAANMSDAQEILKDHTTKQHRISIWKMELTPDNPTDTIFQYTIPYNH